MRYVAQYNLHKFKTCMFIPHSDIYIQKIYINHKRTGNQEKRSGNKK